jgi:hypothetical protein
MNYWLVGATEDQGCGYDNSTDWQEEGIWKLMWDEGVKPAYDAKLVQMQVGDRIAIKAMRGQGQPTIRIKAIGIIKSVSIEGRLVVVNWVVENMNRVVASKGCYGTLHGPFAKDNWVRRVFCL